MTEVQRSEIKTKILEEMVFVKREIKELQELCQPVSPECSLGDLARFELMNDQMISEKALVQAQIRKNKLDYAFSKIDKESFGLCMECEEEISHERLLLVPESIHCIECASDLSKILQNS